MKKLLTLGIPAYNVEKYLAECLDTVINDNLEVLIINDGSKDNTESIGLEYQKKYPNIFKVITKENGGWGSGVNRAIKEAQGEYFKNLDSDDKFDKEGLKSLLENIKKSKADIIVSPAITWNEQTNATYETPIPKGIIFDKTMPLEEMLCHLNSPIWMHELTFKTSLLQDNHINIDERFYTDMELAAYPFEYAKTIFAQHEPVYIYRVGRSGQSMSLPSMAKHMDDRQIVTNSIIGKYLNGYQNEYFKKYVLASIYSFLTQPFAIKDRKIRNGWIEELKKFKETIIDKTPSLSNYDEYLLFAKLILKFNFAFYGLFAFIWRFGKKVIAPIAHFLHII